jgi:hypothetical protein
MIKLICSAPQKTFFPNSDSVPPRALVGSITQLMLVPPATHPADFALLRYKVLSKHLSPHPSDFDLRPLKVQIHSVPLGLLLGITLRRLPLDYQLYKSNLRALLHLPNIADVLRNWHYELPTSPSSNLAKRPQLPKIRVLQRLLPT